MTIPSTGAISLQDVEDEFGGAHPIDLDDYYRGGALVSAAVLPGVGSSATAPLTPASPSPIPTSGTIQLSQFRGTTQTGDSNIITAPGTHSLSVSDFVDVTLPAGVDFIRFYLVGGGGGAGGWDGRRGGNGGGGSTISGTISTSAFGSVGTARTLRFFIGRGGQAGSNTSGFTATDPLAYGGHGYALVSLSTSSFGWGTFLNTYGVAMDMVGGTYFTTSWDSQRMVSFPVSGTYEFEFAADEHVKIFLDGTQVAATDVASLNDQGSTASTSSTRNTTNPLTKSVSVTAGFHKLTFRLTNTASVGAFGVRLLNPSSVEVWNTRDDYSSSDPYATPCGGTGGNAGTDNSSGTGGGGGSATKLILVAGGTSYVLAMAGGGGGGGGAGINNPANVDNDGNWATQGWLQTNSPISTAGGEGEWVERLNNNSANTANLNEVFNDGGGGGGGGGGIRNTRMYFTDTSKDWYYSGFGGRTSRGTRYPEDNDADGGESGKSAVTGFSSLYDDFIHGVTTTTTPRLPSGMPISLAGYGVGGIGTTTSAADGGNGAAYVDWGYTNASVGTPSMTYAALRCGIVIFDNRVGGVTIGSSSTDIAIRDDQVTAFIADAFGGGGNPGSNYTYSWTRVSGPAVTFSAATSFRTTITTSNVSGSTGTIRCTVNDGSNTAFDEITYRIYT
jgi:PA14 domain